MKNLPWTWKKKWIAKRFRVSLVFLLVLSLSPAAILTSWQGELHDFGADSQPVRFISGLSVNAASVFSIRTRSHFASPFDDLLKSALIPERPRVAFVGKSFTFFEENAGIIHGIERAVVPIRAPPFFSAANPIY